MVQSLFNTASLRSYFVKALLASLVVAAGAGIFALLFGTFDIIQGRILLTTLLIGIYSVISLCCMTASSSRFAAWGLIGIGVSTLSLVLGILAVWVDFGNHWDVFAQIAKYFAIFGIIGVSIGHQSLLLRLITRPNASARALVGGTVGVIGIVAAMLVVPLVLENFDLGDPYWRLLGVFAILDVLGTIVAPVVTRVTNRTSK